MYQLFVEEHFDAAHRLQNYHGKCENLHGHRFKAIARLEATKLEQNGMAYDFAQLKRHLREVLAPFDHAFLNEVPPFNKIEPSCENIAATIYGQLQPYFSQSAVKLVSVEVWESPTSGVAYSL
ncbi:MAG TPA: 6-carboxytetrahydropterin synthase QueD [Dehalococcoidia bacterium]|nr:6-carboxytetrahydropterin synthase QueD [Dehalococcoidia bacterium]